MPTHICRFKIVSLSCVSMPNGQQYLIHYIRGDTDRSSPSFQANNGVVDFSRMPEGAAIIHFKSGKVPRFVQGQRAVSYAPKLIQLRVDEYHQNAPRRTVGETQVDCSQVIQDVHGLSGSGILSATFRMYGSSAKIRVAVLVYKRDMAPLSFDSLLSPEKLKEKAEAEKLKEKEKKPAEVVKLLAREEATTLLISLEALQERRARDRGSVGAFPDLEAELERLEEKRNSLVGSEGLASQVVRARCHDCVAAQFRDLRNRHRPNFIGTTAAFLREMALKSKYTPLEEEEEQEAFRRGGGRTGRKEEKKGGRHAHHGHHKNNTRSPEEMEELRRNLTKVDDRIDQLRRELGVLEKEQETLQQRDDIESCMEVLLTNANKMELLLGQVSVLEISRNAIRQKMESPPEPSADGKGEGGDDDNDNDEDDDNDNGKKKRKKNREAAETHPVISEMEDIQSRIAWLEKKRPELQKRINHMNSVAINHIVAWARAKNPTEEEEEKQEREAALRNVDELFGGVVPPSASAADVPTQDLSKVGDGQAEGKKNKKKNKKSKDRDRSHSSSSASSSESSSSSSESSSSDSSDSSTTRKKKNKKDKKKSADEGVDESEPTDPFAPKGLSKNIFSSGFQRPTTTTATTTTTTTSTANNFMSGAGGAGGFFTDPADWGRADEMESHSAPPAVPSSSSSAPGLGGGGYDEYVRRRKAQDSTYDPLEDYSPSSAWGTGAPSAGAGASADAPSSSSFGFGGAGGGGAGAKNNALFFGSNSIRNTAGSDDDDSSDSSDSDDNPMKPKYDFGGGSGGGGLEYKRFYGDSVPKYSFGS